MYSPSTAPTDQLPNISGYQLIERLYSGSRTAVYRGVSDASQPVIIKVLRNDHPSFSELLQFRNQYTITQAIAAIPGIVHPLSLETLDGSYALVMEDWGGMALNQYVKEQTALPCNEVLAIALQVTDILHDLYQHQIIHKDIKPANILIQPASKQVKLIDFSIASLLPKEMLELQSPNVLEGTLAYLAPEQTGRMNRGIDYRADFYTLGVTLYELLSGRLPFTSEDPLELVHCHIAQQPVPVEQVNSSVPEVVGAIVAKLMAKNVEDRYQSALGLKHDLQQCLAQWEATGEILAFELGQRDLSDRFLIPEKLYGRETEVETLLASFERVSQSSAELMLVAGFSGIGKTAVVNEVHKPITRQNGYFCKGKFDQFNRNIPFSAVVQALRGLIGQLLSESDARLQTWKQSILVALGENGQVIIDVIPELERLIGAQPAATELSGTAAQSRFNLLFQKFIQVFTTPEHPLVIFLDDLQWADSASLNLIQVLMTESTMGHLLLIGAYRDNEVFAAHPLMLTLDTLQQAAVAVNTIVLQPLSQPSLNQLIAETLHCTDHVAQPLTELVFQKTQGNPFFGTQFLKALHQDQLITFDRQSGYWQYDVAQVRDAALTDDVVELMAQQLQKLPEATQAMLKLAACMGAQFDLATLAIVSKQSPTSVATALWKALQEGLILPQNQVYKFYLNEAEPSQTIQHERLNYKFLHDRIQQAAYSLIAEDHKQATHWQMGQLLLRNTATSEQEERLFEIVNHLNAGRSLIAVPQEYEALVELNLRAGQKAKSATAYRAAVDYLTTGISLLPSGAWEDHYDLTLALYTEVAEAAYLSGEIEQMDRWIQVVQQQAKTCLEQVKIYEIKLQSLQAQGEQLKAIKIGREILQQLGIGLPELVTSEEIYQSVENTLLNCQAISVEHLSDLPLMTDAQALGALKIMISIVPSAHQAAPYLFPIIACEEVNLALKYGNSPLSAPGYADFGIIVNTVLNKLEEGYQFGQLALSLVDRLDAKSVQSMTYLKVAAFNQYNRQPIQSCIKLLKESYTVGLETGDMVHVFVSTSFRLLYTFLSSREILETLLEEINVYQTEFASVQHFLVWSSILGQTIENLITPRQHPGELIGTYCDESTLLPILLEANDESALHGFFLNKLMLSYLFDQESAALCNAALGEQYLKAGAGMFSVPIFYYYDSLARLAIYPTATPADQAQILLKVGENQAYLKDRVQFAPMNFQHYYDLVEAERHRVLGLKVEALEAYDRAIAGAKENQYLQEEALANELAAKFYLDWSKEKVAAGYMQEAYNCYTRWGAKAKIDDLERRYPELLQPILQSTPATLNVLETLASIAAPNLTGHSSRHPSASSSTSINATLDLATILKASQSLTGTMQIDELLHQLTQIILQNSGADRCALILPNAGGEWTVEALATPASTELCAEPLDDNSHIPVKLIHYVKNTQAVVMVNDGKNDLPVVGAYWSQDQPQSILCLPIVNQTKLMGILYLENRVTSNVFTNDRILILDFLCTQAAISLENARLYAQVQGSQRQLATLLSNLTGMAYSCLDDEYWTMQFVSQDCFNLTGYTPEEFVDTRTIAYAKLIHPEDAKLVDETVQEALAKRSPFQVTYRIRTKQGVEKWVWEQGRGIFDENDQFLAIEGLITDISDRKQAEAALLESENYYRTLFEESSIGLVLCDLNGKLLYANTAYASILGREPSELPSLTYWEITPASYMEAEGQQLQSLQMTGRYGPYEKDYIHKDGTLIPVRLSGVIVERHGQQLIWSSVEDITDRKQAEQALQQSLQELQQAQIKLVQGEKMSALGNLVAGVAHEINNPVGCIVGNVKATQDYITDLLGLIDLYREKFPQPGAEIEAEIEAVDLDYVREDLPKLIRSMKDGGERIKAISKSLRTFSRADTDAKQLFDLHEGIESTVLILRHRLKANERRPEIRIQTEYSKLAPIACFPGQLNQVFMNILANAIDALDESNQGQSFAEIEANPNQITIRTMAEDNQVKIMIVDNGPGMPEAVKNRIFDHLFTTKGVGKGTGLGLAIARQIIEEKHGGKLEVQSQIGQGTTFCINLPIHTGS